MADVAGSITPKVEESALATPPDSNGATGKRRHSGKRRKGRRAHTVDRKAGRPSKPLPTTRVGFTKQLNMLRSYVELSTPERPATTAEVCNVVTVHPNTGVLVNPFFADVGLIQKMGSGYAPSAEAIAFHRAYSWNAETAAHKLAPVFSRTWFGRKLLPRLALNSMDERQAVELLGQEIGAGPTYEGQVALLLEYLGVAGLIRREGGVVRAGSIQSQEDGPMPTDETTTTEVGTPPQRRAASSIATAFNQAPEGVLRFNVDVSVDMKEFSTWQPERITAFWAGIAQVLSAKAAVEQGPKG